MPLPEAAGRVRPTWAWRLCLATSWLATLDKSRDPGARDAHVDGLAEVKWDGPVWEHSAELGTDDGLHTWTLCPVSHRCGVGPGQATAQGSPVEVGTTPCWGVLTQPLGAPLAPAPRGGF